MAGLTLASLVLVEVACQSIPVREPAALATVTRRVVDVESATELRFRGRTIDLADSARLSAQVPWGALADRGVLLYVRSTDGPDVMAVVAEPMGRRGHGESDLVARLGPGMGLAEPPRFHTPSGALFFVASEATSPARGERGRVSGVYRIEPGSGAARLLTGGRAVAAFDLDGDDARLVYVAIDERSACLRLIDLDRDEDRLLSCGDDALALATQRPRFRPATSQVIVATTTRSGRQRLVRIDVEVESPTMEPIGREFDWITPGPWLDRDRLLIVAASSDHPAELAVVDLRDRRVRTLCPLSSRSVVPLVLASDGAPFVALLTTQGDSTELTLVDPSSGSIGARRSVDGRVTVLALSPERALLEVGGMAFVPRLDELTIAGNGHLMTPELSTREVVDAVLERRVRACTVERQIDVGAGIDGWLLLPRVQPSVAAERVALLRGEVAGGFSIDAQLLCAAGVIQWSPSRSTDGAAIDARVATLLERRFGVERRHVVVVNGQTVHALASPDHPAPWPSHAGEGGRSHAVGVDTLRNEYTDKLGLLDELLGSAAPLTPLESPPSPAVAVVAGSATSARSAVVRGPRHTTNADEAELP